MPPYRKKEQKPTTPTEKNGSYTDVENEQIIGLYEEYSNEPNKWKLIATRLGRNHKSVRERYVNHLDPFIDKSDLTTEEKLKIDELQKIYLKKWADIAKELSKNRKGGRRTELQVKNYWNSKHRTNNRHKEKSFERISSRMNIKAILN
ncbi:hypothetical protein RclHR1_10060002 [Rhizophagus clarus]|uniref:Transcription factor MYB3R-3 n=1 Tax=Rhizophagus clarus TaxID=94130 RepID=A0A2Z6QCC6_9GLOM|nr:hypothetical protein RclHR1_10060002 [Rhizophagus clarus]GES85347.1 transcription factor MYB3R-3 [Rhizophagus clarus]